MIEQIIYGAITGLVYSGAGWLKEEDIKKADFDYTKLLKSVVICAVVGGIAGYSNADFGILITSSTGIAITKAVSIVWKIGKKYLKK